MFLTMLGLTYTLPGAMHPHVARDPLLHGYLHAYWVGSQHHVSCWGVPPLVSRHSPWRSTCFSPWLAPPSHCQVPCTHLLMGWQPGSWWLHGCPTHGISSSTMEKLMFFTMLGLTYPLPGVMHQHVARNPLLHGYMHAYWVDNKHPCSCWGVPPLVSHHPPWRSTCFPLVGPTYPLPCVMHTHVARDPLLHGYLLVCWVDSLHPVG
jgi:hypothetical protein